MKLFLVSALLIVNSAFGATIDLKLGDSITISPGEYVTVTCGGGDADTQCRTPIRNLKTKLDACKSAIGSSVAYCLDDYWPAFKTKNPTCVEAAFDTCVKFCRQDPFERYCLNLCE